MGALQGLSIGYRVTRATREAKGVRTIKAAYLGEVSFVTTPMNDRARVTAIKSKGKNMEPEDTINKVEELKTKIADLETKGAKVDELETKLGDAIKRADDFELKMNRPGAFATKDEVKDVQKKAFNVFLRGGVGALGDNERKSLGLERKDLTVGDPNASVFAPPEFAAEIIKNLVLFSPIRAVARVMQIGAAEVKIPRRTGNLTATWVSETGVRTEGTPAYDNATIAPYELACFVDVSNALLEDAAYDIASEVAYDLGEEFGRAEGAAFVTGNGASAPEGILTNASVAQINSGSAATFTAAALMSFFHALPSPYANNGSWLMNRSTIGFMRGMQDTTGRFLWTDGLTPGNPPTLLGRPVIEAPDFPDIAANALPIAFGDAFAGYRVVDRVSLALLRDPYSMATNGLTRFHARRRVGGKVVKPEAFRIMKIAA